MDILLNPVVISVIAFVAVAGFAIAAISLFGGLDNKKAEDRLEVILGKKLSEEERQGIMKDEMLKLGSSTTNAALNAVSRYAESWSLFFEQADSPVKFDKFLMISFGAGVAGAAGGFIANAPLPLVPVFGILTATVPLLWLVMRRKKRFKMFGKQLPDAMELMSRALRSGHSLASGLHLVCEEMPSPISDVFRAAFETQNLGVPIEQALKDSLKLMPNLDFKFFVTAVAIQRQTGGDLAEILDKISEVIRERFKILGTVQALTGEGRLSGAVLMAMPIAIFFACYFINPGYVMVLFTHPTGKQMIAVGIIMQIFGAIAIKKIIDIKV